MKTHVGKVLFVTLFLSGINANTPQGQTFTMTTTAINSIVKENMRHSDQIRFSFDASVHADYTVDEDENSCTISFWNLPFNSVQSLNLVKKVKSSSPAIASAIISKLSDEKSSIEGTQLKIMFSNKNIHVNVQILENPHQIAIDITSMGRLFNKLNQNNVISHAYNTKQHEFFTAQLRA